MSHGTPCMARVKNPTKRLSKVVKIIYDPTDMDHLDNILLLQILDLKIGSFNIVFAVGRMTIIDNIDTDFIVFTQYCTTSRRLSKVFEDMTNTEIDFSNRYSSIELNFGRAKSSSRLSLWTPRNSLSTKNRQDLDQ